MMKITTKSQIEKRQARTEDAMLLKLMLQRPAPITSNPMLCVRAIARSEFVCPKSAQLFIRSSLFIIVQLNIVTKQTIQEFINYFCYCTPRIAVKQKNFNYIFYDN